MSTNRFQRWAIACLSVIAITQPVWANPVVTDSRIIFNAPPPPTDQGAPRGRSQGGASRGSCEQYQELTALVPTPEGRVWGLTASEHPTLWFYLPSALTADVAIEFVLQDATDQELYRTQFTSDTQPGLIRLAVPDTAPAMEPDKPYFWTLAIYCNPARPSESVFVQGTVQRLRLTPNQQRQFAAAAPLERSRLYAASGLWYDSLTMLADLRATDPAQAETAWLELLRQVGLEAVAEQPIAPCCTPQ
ncbi:DUF928 domain-containing protein [Oculatella sp. LEGE 06141]|uniref:DUF928 domain-containing protein n=1 Tax=Oculatella sp. LEGE 06141 TaxID=1828648 RepID=UPI00188110F5|nr:DUF928 domain-containing protein [Oculatella sp. LEGE 06141]MBE9178155.1 DUF928 domain-containing protein [Oculatella sp. LEGE 06141]